MRVFRERIESGFCFLKRSAARNQP
jgi:hypothetical protein